MEKETKKFIWLLIVLVLVMLFLSLFNFNSVASTQPISIELQKDTVFITHASDQNSEFDDLLFRLNLLLGISIILGYVGSAFYFTKKAIKTKQETPSKFDFIFWLKDNITKKINTLLTF